MTVVAAQDRHFPEAESVIARREQDAVQEQHDFLRFLTEEVTKKAPPTFASLSARNSLCVDSHVLKNTRAEDVPVPCRRRSALRVGAQGYDPRRPPSYCSPAFRSSQIHYTLSVFLSYLRLQPGVTHVAEERESGGRSARYEATACDEACAEGVVGGAQQALLQAALHSRSVYVTGHAREPFAPLGLRRRGFRARLCVADERLCMDAVDFGRCNRYCPRTECHRKHPQECHFMELVVEVQPETQRPHEALPEFWILGIEEDLASGTLTTRLEAEV